MKRINKYGCFKSDDVCIIHDCPLLGDNFCEESEIIKSYKQQIIQDLLDKVKLLEVYNDEPDNCRRIIGEISSLLKNY
jgi:hypothetical protein